MKFSDIKYLKTVVDSAALEESVSEVAFVGRSNVGKSSVINAVCRRKKLAYTSQIPGKTRTINVFGAGQGRWLVDLPGYGYATGPASERSAWPAMIEGYLTTRPNLRMVYIIIDAEVGPTKLDKSMTDWLVTNAIPFTIVANKTDKVSKSAQDSQRGKVANELGVRAEDIHWVSAEKNWGIPKLIAAIALQLEEENN
ncbi:MAG: ribosome biogenesis GTP-binding protein YihA/YsxC [Elusimicrobiota bacterium]